MAVELMHSSRPEKVLIQTSQETTFLRNVWDKSSLNERVLRVTVNTSDAVLRTSSVT